MLLMIDNYDSFTYNLVHYLQILNQKIVVARNDKITINDIERQAPRGIIISPGPGTPSDAGMSSAIINYFAGKVPILGICLGHQCIAQVFGGKIIRAKQVRHGKISLINHDQQGIFTRLKQPIAVVRYHSLLVDSESMPDCLKTTAWCDKEIMGIRHLTYPIDGVQFHPESILTEQGFDLLGQFVQNCP